MEAPVKPEIALSKRTIKNKRNDKIFKGFLWGSVIFTMFILLFIVGYVLVRGVFYSNRIEYQVANYKEEKILVNPGQNDFIYLIVNKDVRIKDIAIPVVNKIFNGDEYEWGNYSGQDKEIIFIAYRENKGIYADALKALMAEDDELSEYAELVSGEQEMLDKVASTPGAFGYIDADSGLNLKKVKKVKLRRIIVAVNKDVREIVNQKRLLYLDHENLDELFGGNYNNWQEVGGIDLPLIPVINLSPESYNNYFIRQFLGKDFKVPENAITVSSDEAFFETLKTVEGTYSLCSYHEYLDYNLTLTPIKRNESGISLTLPFLFEATRKAGRVGGIRDIILNTLMLIALTLLIAAPLGIFSAVYLIEYAKQGRIIRILRLGTETLSGIPSIIFGLFGYIVFVQLFKFQMGLLSGSLTMTIMILPTIIRTSEEALKTVPMSIREGSLALGATKWQTIVKVVIPAASRGIISGIILALGRTVGETAALLFTMGSGYHLFSGLSSSGRSLALHLYFLFSEGISEDKSFTTGAILIVIIIIINFITTRLMNRMNSLAGNK